MNVTRQIHLGGVAIGGGAPVVVQSMTSTPAGDARATLEQVRALAAAGSELVRVSLPSDTDTDAFAEVVHHAPVPIIADIHFDWRLALAALERGAAAVRINPGTIGSDAHVHEIVRAAAAQGAVIRIGVNSGSLPRELRHPGRDQTDRRAGRSRPALRGPVRGLGIFQLQAVSEELERA